MTIDGEHMKGQTMGAFENGQYRNLFKEIGKSDAEIEAKIKSAVETFFYDENERIYHEAGEDMGYLTDTGSLIFLNM